MVGQASNQAIAVDRVGAGTHRAGQILGKALQANSRRPTASRVTTKPRTNTNPASHPQVGPPKPYKRFTRRPTGNRQYLVPQHDRALATAAQRKTKVFTQATIRIKKQAFGKLQQHHRWGTPKWIEAYNHRTAVEGVFGNLKDREQGGIDRCG